MIFGTNLDFFSNTVSDTSFKKYHEIKLAGLEKNTLYFYTVESCNDNTCYFSEMYNFTTANINTESKALKIDNLRIINEYARAGEDISLAIRLQNNRNDDMNDVRVTIVLPEIGIRKRIGPFDLSDDDEINKQIHLTLPDDVMPGEYVAKITISGNDGKIRRVKHRYVTVY